VARWDLPQLPRQNCEEASSGQQGGRMSFSGRGYHDYHETQRSINNRLTSNEETTTAIQSTPHQHSQWQAMMGHEMASLQQQQQHQNQNYGILFQNFNIQPPH